MTHTEGASPQPEPAPRWRYLDPMEGVAHEPGERYLVRGTVSAVARVIAADVMAERILDSLNAAEALREQVRLALLLIDTDKHAHKCLDDVRRVLELAP